MKTLTHPQQHGLLTRENEVIIEDVPPLSAYKYIATPQEYKRLGVLAKKLKSTRVLFINATPQGGGVAIMRQSLMRLFRALKMDIRWFVLQPDPEIFLITKRKFHNVLQGVSPVSVRLTTRDKKAYEQWTLQNALFFDPTLAQTDVVVIDDPQAAGLIPYIKQHFPTVKIIYRSHIHIDTSLIEKKGSPQAEVWRYLWKYIKKADVFVSHPVAEFIPPQVSPDKVAFLPPSTDPLSDLNRKLTDVEQSQSQKLFNTYLKENDQKPLDFSKPYVIQIARFDPSKGIPDVLEAFAKLTLLLKQQNQELPQLVITGNASIDDPDGVPVLAHSLEMVSSQAFKAIHNQIKVIQLPPNDILLNALLRKSMIALQLSHKEGFEFKVTEALMKGKPVLAYKAGGIPLQIKDGVNGFLANVGDVDTITEHLYELLTDEKKYQAMSQAAGQHYDKNFLTIPNAIAWMNMWKKVCARRDSNAGPTA